MNLIAKTSRSTPVPAAAAPRRRFALRPLVLALAAGSLMSPPAGLMGEAVAQTTPGAPPAAVLPNGLNVVHGQAKLVTNGRQMTVTNSAGSILNWQSFSIGSGNAVHFAQPDAASQVLNRVVGNDPSSILGSLSSNGRVWLLNPNGVLFGQNARVDVAGLVTSTLGLNNSDWLAGRYNLSAGPGAQAGIVNQGELRSSLGGRIALLGGSVRNEGLIDAPGGQVLLAAGRSIDLVDTGSPNLRLRVTAPEGEALNLGTLAAAGGRIDVHAAVVNQQGLVRADSLGVGAAGEIVLRASQSIDLAAGSTTSASGGTGGRITLDSGQGTAGGSTLVHGELHATGSAGRGGDVQLLGKHVGLLGSARVDASGTLGGGEVLVGGGERGQDSRVPNADAVYVAPLASIRADATERGDGGRVILWSDTATRAYGSFSARGGLLGGNGGFIETSGGTLDVRPASIDATAPAGLAGTWLLDPFNILITDAIDTVSVNNSGTGTFTAVDNGAQIRSSDIVLALNNGNNVVVTTGTGGSEAGDISVNSANIIANPNVPVSFSLFAARNINVANSVISSTGGPLSVNLQAGQNGFGRVDVDGSTVNTAGGNFTARGIGFGFDSAPFDFGYGVSVVFSDILAGAGSINLSGSTNSTATAGANTGVYVFGSDLRGSVIELTGNALAVPANNFAYGVDIGSSLVDATRTLSITGAASGPGVYFSSATLAAGPAATDPGASLTITGTSAGNNSGVTTSGGYGGTLIARNGATIAVTANTASASAPALFLNNVNVDAASGGNATFRANTAQIAATMTVGGQVRLYADRLRIDCCSQIRSLATDDALVVAGNTSANTTDFVNSAGAGAFATPTAGARWLVYGQDRASVTPGGLAFDFSQFNARFGEFNPLTPATGNGLLYAVAPVVTVNGNNYAKTYDATTAAGTLASASPTFSGLQPGDVVNVGSTQAVYDTKNAGLNKPVTIAPGGLVVTDANGRPVLGYGLTSNLRGDILRATLGLVGVTANNKVYDATTLATLNSSAASLSGVYSGDFVALDASSLTGNFNDKNVGVGKPVSVTGIALTGSDAANYTATPPTGLTANITPAPLTVTGLVANNKAYDGNTAATLNTGAAQLSGLYSGDTVVLNTSSLGASFNTPDAGNAKPVSVGGAAISGADAGNYTLGAVPSLSANINPAALTITANNASKPFGTTLVFNGTEFGSSGLVAGQTIGSVTLSSPGAPASASVAGGPYPITPSNPVGGNFNPSNYSISFVNGTLTVTPVDLQAVLVAIVGNPTKVYDGNDTATLTPANYSLSGFVGSDSATVTQTNGRYDSPNAGSRTVTASLASSNFTPQGSTDLSNYVLPTLASGNGTILTRSLSLVGTAANNKVYDGNTLATLSSTGTLVGLVAGQTLGLSFSNARFDTKDAGTGKAVTVEGLTLSNGSGLAANYALASTTTTTADITPRSLTLAGVTAANKVYDGTRAASITLGGLVGLVGSETLATSAAGEFDTKDAGTGKTVSVTTTLGNGSNGSNGGLAGNYVLAPNPTTTTADITPKGLTLTSVTAANKVYDGTRVASITLGGLSGLVGSETLSTSASGQFDTKDAGTGKTVSVTTTLGNGSNGGLAGNYVLAPNPTTTTADITPKAITITGTRIADKVYDGTTTASVTLGTINGLVGNETLSAAVSGNFDTKDAGTNKAVNVNVVLGNGSNGGLADNYLLAAGASILGTESPNTVALGGTGGRDKRLESGVDGDGRASAQDLVLAATGRASILPKALVLNPGGVSAANKVYDGNTAATVSIGAGALSGLVGNETLGVTAAGQFNTKDVGTAKPVAVTVNLGNGANGGLSSNYLAPALAVGAVRANITPASLVYNANPASKLVGAPLPALSGNVTGFVAGENQAVATTGSLVFTTPAGVNSPAGSYAIDGGGLTATNYSFSQAAGNATALSVAGLEPQAIDNGSQVATSQSLVAVIPPQQFSSPTDGRVFDLMQALRASFLNTGLLFRSVPVGSMSQDALSGLLAARDRYKKSIFAEAIYRLEQDPTLADVRPCQSVKEVFDALDDGKCLMTEELKRQIRAEREALQVAATTPPAPAPVAPPTAAPPSGAAPSPAAPPAPPPRVVAAAPRPAPLFTRRVRVASLPQIERKIAVVIGVDRYDDKVIPQLDNAVGDAKAVGQMLETSLGYETIVLENATKQSVVRNLNRLALEVNPRDSVVVYYAGHGELIESTAQGYWQLSDSEAKKPESWLSNADISRLVAQVGASQVALISDSCYSGSLVDERIRASAGQVDPLSLLTRKTVVVMSSGGNEPVFDDGKNGHSPFAFNLMANLRQVASWQVGGNVFERVRFAVARELPQRPRYGAASAAGHQPGGDYLFEQRQLDARP